MRPRWIAAIVLAGIVLAGMVLGAVVLVSSPADDLDHTPSRPPANFTPHPLSLGVG